MGIEIVEADRSRFSRKELVGHSVFIRIFFVCRQGPDGLPSYLQKMYDFGEALPLHTHHRRMCPCVSLDTRRSHIRIVSSQEAACSKLGVFHSQRGQHSKAKDMFERNFVISRKVVNARQGGASTGEASKRKVSDVWALFVALQHRCHE